MRTHTLPDPVKLVIDAGGGHLVGSNGRYEKRLPDLHDIYQDSAAYAAALAGDRGEPVYWVENCHIDGSGELITGISVLEPGRIGDEFYMTRGHLHRQADRAELYLAVSGRGVLLMETLDGQSRAIEICAGEAVQIPGHWVHRSVNVGPHRFATVFCFAADAGQDYEVIAEAGGMKNLVVTDGSEGWSTRPNPAHRGYRRG